MLEFKIGGFFAIVQSSGAFTHRQKRNRRGSRLRSVCSVAGLFGYGLGINLLKKSNAIVLKLKSFYVSELLVYFDAKTIIRFAAFGILLIVGHFQYVDSYQFPKWKVFFSGMIMGAPFSMGMLFSTFPLGKRFKIFTSVLIIFSALVRSLLLVSPIAGFVFFLVELYAIWNLFSRGSVR